MNRSTFFLLVLFSFIVWSIPFVLRLTFNTPYTKTQLIIKHAPSGIVKEIFGAYSKNNRWSVFCLIFLNNIKVIIYNITGGVFLGLGTIVNLLRNGFYAADTFSTIHNNGMSWNEIISYTLPHSFELLGIWISGAVGLSMAKLFIDIIRDNKLPTVNQFKFLGFMIGMSGFIILLAAFIEAYISVPGKF